LHTHPCTEYSTFLLLSLFSFIILLPPSIPSFFPYTTLFRSYIFMIYFRKHLIDPASAGIVQAIFIFGLIMSFLQPRVNVAAHVCGFIGGLIIAAPILINAEAFSHVKNYMKRSKSRQTDDTDNRDASFNPNRWKRSNRLSAETSRKLKRSEEHTSELQ